MKNKVFLVIGREYAERVRRKSFIITTVIMPLVMIAMMGLPAVMMMISGPEDKNIAVVDHSNRIAPFLQNEGGLRFSRVDISADSAKHDPAYDAVLVIGAGIIDNPDAVDFYTHESSAVTTEQLIAAQISSIISRYRLQRYDIPDLDKIMASVQADVHMTTYRIGDEADNRTSALASYIVAMVMMMMLYMFVMMYGNMVMTSIIEEKTNRVLEVIVSSMTPRQLLFGKIAGIGLVAVTQVALWAVIVFAFVKWGMPAINQGVAGSGAGVEMLDVVNTLGNPGYVMTIFGYMILFLIGGYVFYSSIYAAIGSAVDNVQDASQLAGVAIVPVIVGLMVSLTVVNDPNGQLAMWASFIPFTSPMVMMSRLPFGVPVWQTVVSLAVLYASGAATIAVAAKIYRVGIFMYGKKPTLRQLAKWARYK